MHPAPAIVVTPPGGEPPNRAEAEKHISYASTASSVAPVQDRACALELLEFAPEILARDILPKRREGPCRPSLTMALRYTGPHVSQNNLAKTLT